jgi:hypothetical protein
MRVTRATHCVLDHRRRIARAAAVSALAAVGRAAGRTAGQGLPCVDRRGLCHCGYGGHDPLAPVPWAATRATRRRIGPPGRIAGATAGPAPVTACCTVSRTRASAATSGSPGAPSLNGRRVTTVSFADQSPRTCPVQVGTAGGPVPDNAAARPSPSVILPVHMCHRYIHIQHRYVPFYFVCL